MTLYLWHRRINFGQLIDWGRVVAECTMINHWYQGSYFLERREGFELSPTAETRFTNDCHEWLTTRYCANVCWCCLQLKDLHEIVHDCSLTKTILDSMNDYRNHSQTPWLITNYERYTLTDCCPMRLFIDIRYLTFLTSLIYHSSRCSAVAGLVQCILSTIIFKFNIYIALIQDSYVISYINLSEV